ncbi:MAG: cation:proton antiporter, partial [Bacteroidota bacterium]
LAENIVHESGLLAVVIMGTVMGNLEVPRLKEILSFKESMSVLLISMLFILLAANINIEYLLLIVRDWRSFALFAFVALVLRPLVVLVSTRQSELNLQEKLFISWVGPRGIVAAGIASLFGITLTKSGVPGAEYITPLVFMIVLGTVLLNATTARIVAKALGVIQEDSGGILIVGSSKASRIIAKYLQDHGRSVIIVDNNESSIRKAQNMELEALQSNIYTEDLNEKFELLDVGYLIAMTSSTDVNEYALKKYRKEFGERGSYRLISSEELTLPMAERPQDGLFSYTDDFLNLNEVARDDASLHELPLSSVEELKIYFHQLARDKEAVPLFIKNRDGEILIMPKNLDDLALDGQDFLLIYMGHEIEKDPDVEDILKNIDEDQDLLH